MRYILAAFMSLVLLAPASACPPIFGGFGGYAFQSQIVLPFTPTIQVFQPCFSFQPVFAQQDSGYCPPAFSTFSSFSGFQGFTGYRSPAFSNYPSFGVSVRARGFGVGGHGFGGPNVTVINQRSGLFGFRNSTTVVAAGRGGAAVVRVRR